MIKYLNQVIPIIPKSEKCNRCIRRHYQCELCHFTDEIILKKLPRDGDIAWAICDRYDLEKSRYYKDIREIRIDAILKRRNIRDGFLVFTDLRLYSEIDVGLLLFFDLDDAMDALMTTYKNCEREI